MLLLLQNPIKIFNIFGNKFKWVLKFEKFSWLLQRPKLIKLFFSCGNQKKILWKSKKKQFKVKINFPNNFQYLSCKKYVNYLYLR